MQDTHDYSVLKGTYTKGKMDYTYPDWMLRNFGGIILESKGALTPHVTYEIYNPNNITMVEGNKYDFRVISLIDGEVAEVIKKAKQ